jgi:mannose-6-phosphate isomerase-like protein (cupin superfamily)
MESYQGNSIDLKDYLVYLNIQGMDSRSDDIYKSPLNKLKGDIPTPSFLKDAWDNMTAVNLWMGNSYEGPTTSRLHMDAMDNVYVVLKGHKDFVVYPPNLSNYMRTISPTISVAPNGHSFQFKNAVNSNDSKKKSNSKKTNTYIDYDKDKYHFSYVSSTDDPLLGPALGQERRFSLKPGDILYLPAGWFHQVTSSQGQHQAINYWWKPPDWQHAVKFENKKLKKYMLIKTSLFFRFIIESLAIRTVIKKNILR